MGCWLCASPYFIYSSHSYYPITPFYLLFVVFVFWLTHNVVVCCCTTTISWWVLCTPLQHGRCNNNTHIVVVPSTTHNMVSAATPPMSWRVQAPPHDMVSGGAPLCHGGCNNTTTMWWVLNIMYHVTCSAVMNPCC